MKASNPLLVKVFREICYWVMRARGWKFHINIPQDLRKAVIIAAPHTSQWDFIVGMAAYREMKFLKVHYLAKEELVKGPLRWFFLRTGAIPVDRAQSRDVVGYVAALFEDRDPFYLALSPEGTRSRTEQWRSGFYWIAVKARVPVIMGYFDYGKKEVGIGEVLHPTGDYPADARLIEAYYKDREARHPEQYNWKVT